MSQVEPIKATFSRDEIEKRINESFEGENNRKFTEEPSIQDLMYDELRNLNGALASIDERMCETNDLLWRLVNKETHETTQPVRDYYNKRYYNNKER